MNGGTHSASAHEKRFISVGTKLAGATVLVLAIVAAGVFVEVSHNQRAQLLQSKELATTIVARLFSAGAASSLTFGDDRGAREQISLLEANDQVVYGALWALDSQNPSLVGQKLGEMRRAGFASEPVPTAHSDLRVTRGADWLLAETTVVDLGGNPVGIAQLALSLAGENAATQRSERRTLAASLATGLGLALVLIVLTSLVVVGPVEKLAEAARRMENGESVQVNVHSNDEVGRLARAFDAMTRAIASREQRISERNRDLRRVLDNSADGFLTVDLEGVMSDERARVLDDWFGPPRAPGAFFEYVEQIAPETASRIRLGWEELREDVVPVELVVEQLPHHFEREGRFFETEYRPIGTDARVEQMLVVIRDVTQQIERERAEQGQRETIAIVRRMIADRAGFDHFFLEATALVSAIESDSGADPAKLRRNVHTLKGNCALFGVESVTHFCHALEQRLLEDADAYKKTDRAMLRTLWSATTAACELLGGVTKTDNIEIDVEEYRVLLRALETLTDHATLAAFVTTWKDDRVSTRLARAADQLRALSLRLGKGQVRVRCEVVPSAMRLPQQRWGPFWTVLAHVVRNTIDHGIETPAERTECGKTIPAEVTLSLHASTTGVEIRVTDDGRGIDWEKIRSRAAALGLPHRTAADLEEALYADGVSSREAVTEVSGRGIGMGAVREAIKAMDGQIKIETTSGRGTTLRFLFPSATLPRSMSMFPVSGREVGLRTLARLSPGTGSR
jgi:HPt (histidine-containing phosphotransfer) domain-containing protein/HAMP domain-containing protein